MREAYRGYYRPTEDEFGHLWTNAVVALDANTLLNLYRYSPRTAGEFMNVLRKLVDRLWLPHQAGLEFQRNRLSVVAEQDGAFRKVLSEVEKSMASMEAEVTQYKKYEVLDVSQLIEDYRNALAPFVNKIEAVRSKHFESRRDPFSDPVWDAITDLFAGRVGEPFTDADLSAIYSEGADRYDRKVPPGYKDANKESPARYGDLVIWKELIRHGEATGAPMLFVTDDGKEDWWRIERGQTLGPRVELVEEFWRECSQRIYFYSPEQFLRFAKERLDAEVSDDTIGEAREISERTSNSRVRVQIAARRDDLIRKRRQVQTTLDHMERGLARRQELSHTEAERDHVVARLEEAREEVRRIREIWETLDLSTSDDQRIRPEFQRIQTRILELERQILILSDRRATLEAEIERHSSGALSNPRRRDAYLVRLNSLEAELAEVDGVLSELDGEEEG